MLSSTSLQTLLPAFLLLSGTALGLGYDCTHARDGKTKWDFGELRGKHEVSWVHKHSATWNTTFALDICDPLKKTQEVPCKAGSHVCAIDQEINKDGEKVGDPEFTDIAGDYGLNGGHTDHTWTKLSDSDSNSDSEKDGVRLKLDGGQADDGQKQRAYITFLCPEKKEKRDTLSTLARRDDEDDDEGDGDDGDDGDDDDDDHHSGGSHDDIPEEWRKSQETDDGKGGTLKFKSYKVQGKYKTLRLDWTTKYACEGAVDDPDLHNGDESSSGGGWGFFSWFFFLAFMGILVYFVFFAWINYSRHGATGWDMLPHADTIRDIPYILGDWGRKVVGTVQGGTSRGGYSAL